MDTSRANPIITAADLVAAVNGEENLEETWLPKFRDMLNHFLNNNANLIANGNVVKFIIPSARDGGRRANAWNSLRPKIQAELEAVGYTVGLPAVEPNSFYVSSSIEISIDFEASSK